VRQRRAPAVDIQALPGCCIHLRTRSVVFIIIIIIIIILILLIDVKKTFNNLKKKTLKTQKRDENKKTFVNVE